MTHQIFMSFYLFIYLIFKCFIIFFSKKILRYSQYNGIYSVWNETQGGRGGGGGIKYSQKQTNKNERNRQ